MKNIDKIIKKKYIESFATFLLFGTLAIILIIPINTSATNRNDRVYTYYQPAPFSDSPDYSNNDDYNNSYYSNNRNLYYQYNNSAQYAVNYPTQTSYPVQGQVSNPLPYINSITPDSVTLQRQIIKVTINGSGFLEGSTALFEGQPRTVTFVNSNRLIVQLNEKDITKTGRYYITVTNDAPGGGFSNPVPFTVNKTPAVTTSTSSTSRTQSNQNSAYGASAITGYESSRTNQDIIDYEMRNVETYGSLTSNAIFGRSAFFPTGILQWILFIILVLVIVFVWRKFFGNAVKYHSTPLKHA